MGTPQERNQVDERRRFIVRGGVATLVLGGIGLGFWLGRRGDQTGTSRQGFDSRPTFVPNTAATTAPAIRPSTVPMVDNPSLFIDRTLVTGPDKEGVLLKAQGHIKLIFTAPPERFLGEFAKLAQDQFVKLPHAKESMLRGINSVRDGVIACGATITGLNLVTTQFETLHVEARLNKYCYSQFGYQPGNEFTISYQRDKTGPNPNEWKPYFIKT